MVFVIESRRIGSYGGRRWRRRERLGLRTPRAETLNEADADALDAERFINAKLLLPNNTTVAVTAVT